MVQFETEGFLTQLGYPTNEANQQKLQNIINNTQGFSQLEKHVIQLNDMLKGYNSYVTLSNSKDLLKIKKEPIQDNSKAEIDEIIEKWANKYKVNLMQTEQTNNYYITGRQL